VGSWNNIIDRRPIPAVDLVAPLPRMPTECEVEPMAIDRFGRRAVTVRGQVDRPAKDWLVVGSLVAAGLASVKPGSGSALAEACIA
jgi:hypothetical protein